MIVPVSMIYQANWLEYASVIEGDNPLQFAWDVLGQAVVSSEQDIFILTQEEVIVYPYYQVYYFLWDAE